MRENFEKQRDELYSSFPSGEFGATLISSSETENIDTELIDSFISGFGTYKKTDFVAHIPGWMLENSEYCGELYGFLRAETESFYIIDSKNGKYPVIGYITNMSGYVPENVKFDLIVKRNTDEIYCETKEAEPVRIKRYDEQVKLFSRNSGLLESDWMLNKCAILIGCGSVGSFIALELARSGVGKFVLCDTDALEIHNICRHQCGFDDLGRYKVDAVRDKILNINPKAEVVVFKKMIERISLETLEPFLGKNSIIIGTGDNRESSRYSCDILAIPNDTPFVTACCWTRAFAGEVIYWQPGKNLPCYQCALGDLINSESETDNLEARINYWRSDNEPIVFEPGIAVDIDFVSIVAVKIILDIINRDNPIYTPRVINYLTQYTWICNTNESKIGGEKSGIFSHPLQITHTLHFNKKTGCPVCGNKN
jgi:molybdopterin/thiamine biosynthesis adenylyltransferase